MGRAEAPIETYLCRRVEEAGGFTRKVVYQGRKGSPDRWCFMPGGKLFIVECKAPGKRPDRQQDAEIRMLQAQGFHVEVIDSRERVDELFPGGAL